MLYFIRSFGRNGKSLVKVGYTGDIEQRKSQYYHSNPLYEFVSIREGDYIEEKKIQLYLEILGFKYYKLQEWFEDMPETLQYFHSDINTVNRVIWKNRDLVFKDFLGSTDKRYKKIYEELRTKYNGAGSESRITDKKYNQKRMIEKIKKMKEDPDCFFF